MKLFHNIRRVLGRVASSTQMFGRRFARIDNVSKSELPPQVSQNLIRFGDMNVENVRVCRVPIQSAIHQVFNVLTRGQWDIIRNQVGFDNLFHLYMLLDVGGRTFILEKNQLIRLSEYPPTIEGECRMVDFPIVTLNTMIKNTINKMGMTNFLQYDPFRRNCQDFILNVLQANDASTPELQNFILQPVEKILERLPSYVAPIASGITRIAGYIDTALQKSVTPVDGNQEGSASN